MKTLYNTTDHIYSEEDLKYAFMHAMALGAGGYKHNYNQALSEWKDEYQKNTKKTITTEAIMTAVSDAFGIMEHTITERGGQRMYVTPRYVAMWMMWRYTHASLSSIGLLTGGKHHSTVIHGRDYVDSQLPVSEDIRMMVSAVKARLVSNGYLLEETVRDYMRLSEENTITEIV